MIIGLSGYARSGKDEVAKILVSEFNFERVAFADAIRDLLYQMNPMVDVTRLQTVVDALGWDVAKKHPDIRGYLQDLGVGARKLFGDNFWINQALNPHIYEHPIVGVNKDIVVTDVRFINEAETINSLGGQVWRIKRSGVDPVNQHVSEVALDYYKFDQILKNEGSLDDLRELVRKRKNFSLDAN
jgi:dephospho-CoA kinase